MGGEYLRELDGENKMNDIRESRQGSRKHAGNLEENGEEPTQETVKKD